MNSLFQRAKNILIHPRREWKAIQGEPATYGTVFRYIGILATVPPAAAVMGRLLFDRKISGAHATSLAFVVLSNILWYCMYIISVVITGAVISALLATAGSRIEARTGLRIAAYSFTPFFAAGLLAVIPYMGWTIPVAMAYGVYLLYLGIDTLTAVRGAKAASYTVACFLSAAVIVGVTNLFEYYLESVVMSRIIS